MNDNQDPLTPAWDEFERYYTEKIWDWIPPIYRDEDALASNPDVLRALVSILARQAAIARRSIDRLWEDQFIELCDDWAIPYLGDLVGTRLVHELNRRGLRVDVARTIFYRRRKGTPVVLERLTQDITGWEGTVVESYRRLARTRHGFEPELKQVLSAPGIESLVTPQGGWANLKSTSQVQLASPFDSFASTPDFRQLRGRRGRYNIPKLNFHLYRLRAFPVEFATAANLQDGRFTFDPSGRDLPLFRPDQRADLEEWRSPQVWEFPASIPCRLLGNAQYQISVDLLDELTVPPEVPITVEALSTLVGVPFRHEARLRQTLQSLIADYDSLTEEQLAAFEILFDQLLAGAIAPASPKAYLVPSPLQVDPTAVAIAVGLDLDETNTSLDLEPIAHQQIVAANLSDWGASLVDEVGGQSLLSPQKKLVIDPERGRFWFPEDPSNSEPVWVPIYHYGLAGNVGAGTYERQDAIALENLDEDPFSELMPVPPGDLNNPGSVTWNLPPNTPRSGIIQFDNSKTYTFNQDLTEVERLVVQAANLQRPYLRHLESAGSLEPATWLIEAAPKLASDPEERRTLTLEGLWIGIDSPEALPVPAPCPTIPAQIVLAGNFDRVIIRHCTFDPGGEQAQTADDVCQAIPHVQLVVRGTIEHLRIESSIVGSIVEDTSQDFPCTIERLTIKDSLVHSLASATVAAIDTSLGIVDLERVTIFGDVLVKELNASDTLIQGLVKVVDNQHGCFRFSATNDEPETRLPPQFESHLFAPIPSLFFVSQRFGDPGYGQLSSLAPDSIVRGAENRSEMGVFSSLLNPIKQDDLNAKVNEFMPFGLIAQFIKET